MAKKPEGKEPTIAVVDTLLSQIEDLQSNNEELTSIVNRLTEERRVMLGEHLSENTDSEQRAYELMGHLLEKVTDQRNQAYRRINSVFKHLVK